MFLDGVFFVDVVVFLTASSFITALIRTASSESGAVCKTSSTQAAILFSL